MPDYRYATLSCCPVAIDRWSSGAIRYSESHRGWVIPVVTPPGFRYGAESTTVFFCPWCGARLPQVRVQAHAR